MVNLGLISWRRTMAYVIVALLMVVHFYSYWLIWGSRYSVEGKVISTIIFSNLQPFQIVLFVLTPFVIFFYLPLFRTLAALLAAIISMYVALTAFHAYYFISRGLYFDFFFFWQNRQEAYETITSAYRYVPLRIIVSVVLILIATWALSVVHTRLSTFAARVRFVYVVPVGFVLMLNFITFPAPLYIVAADAYATYKMSKFPSYTELYEESLRSTMPQLNVPLTDKHSIIFLHLESVNSDFVTPQITPQLYDLAEHGILFTKHHSNAVQTHRAEESILCASLPSINISFEQYLNIVDEAEKQKVELNCLPKILKAAGYRTLFFKSHSLAFQRAGEFALSIGFDEVHNSDIMHKDDPLLRWGYREDVYYQRVVEYIQKHYADNKVFAYIAVSSTNHWDWRLTSESTRLDIFQALPYPGSEDYYDRRQNVTFAQDAYLRDFWDYYGSTRSFQNTDVFIFGDHPFTVYSKNPEFSYNIEGGTEQFFLTTLLFVPAEHYRAQFDVNRVINDDVHTDHRGITPTVLELIGIHAPYAFSNSFLPLLRSSEARIQSCSVNIQPFHHVYINLVQYPYKIIINLLQGTIGYAYLPDGEINTRLLHSTLERAEEYLTDCVRGNLMQRFGS